MGHSRSICPVHPFSPTLQPLYKNLSAPNTPEFWSVALRRVGTMYSPSPLLGQFCQHLSSGRTVSGVDLCHMSEGSEFLTISQIGILLVPFKRINLSILALHPGRKPNVHRIRYCDKRRPKIGFALVIPLVHDFQGLVAVCAEHCSGGNAGGILSPKSLEWNVWFPSRA